LSIVPRLSRSRRAGGNRFRPSVEPLEERQVPTVTYHGGAVLPNVGVEALFLGGGWRDDPTLVALRGQLATFLTTIADSSFMDVLTRAGYRVGRGSYLDGAVDPLPPTDSVSDAQLQGQIAALISAGTLKAPDANRLYFVFVQPGVAVTSLFGDSALDLVGYHSDMMAPTGVPTQYAVIPFPGGANATIPGLSAFETLTKVSSHELAESVTDPQGVNVGRLAWWDNTWRDPLTGQRGGEIGDISDRVYFDLDGYVVQAVVNRHRRVLTPAGATLDSRSAGAHHRHRHSPRHTALGRLDTVPPAFVGARL
jgi:hypothetical protein